MKKSEIALIVLIVGLVAFASYFLVNTLLGDVSKKTAIVETAEPIDTKVVQPSPDVFNPTAINPTVKVKIGDQSNQQPFTINR